MKKGNFDEEQENKEEKFESNKNSEESKKSKPEIQILNNIDIDETPSNEEASVSEDKKENLDESGDFEGSDFVPFSRASSEKTNSFLEQSIEPVEDLERDLGGIPNRQQIGNNQSQVLNAPQYASSRDTTRSYYEAPTDDTYPEQIRVASARSMNVSLPFDDLPKTKMLNLNDTMGWRNQEDASYPGDQKYKFSSETKKRRDDF
jgi:hypothetical protein